MLGSLRLLGRFQGAVNHRTRSCKRISNDSGCEMRQFRRRKSGRIRIDHDWRQPVDVR